MLEKLAKAGMNIARLNMSHGDHSSHKSVIDSLKILNKKLDHPVGILLDTQVLRSEQVTLQMTYT